MNPTTSHDSALREIIANINDPFLNSPFGAKSILALTVSGNAVAGVMERPYPCLLRQDALNQAIQEGVKSTFPNLLINLTWQGKVVAHKAQRGIPLMGEVRNIIAVASGKGGVGKSTTTVNVALAMAQEGARVGILDADIYGPSIPQMMGIADKQPQMDEGHRVQPIENYGVQTMSIGFMIDVETPMVWRGPMVSQALDQMVRETAWSDLDYLFVDMPPGTGDIQLTLSQKVPLNGALIVTTPQDIALLDARKGLKMFEKVNVPILGLVENMSHYCCPKCQHREPIFGEGGADKMSSDYDIPVLGKLPLQLSIRAEADSGKPTVVANPSSQESQIYRDIAHAIAINLAKQAKSFDHKMPNIVIQNT